MAGRHQGQKCCQQQAFFHLNILSDATDHEENLGKNRGVGGHMLRTVDQCLRLACIA